MAVWSEVLFAGDEKGTVRRAPAVALLAAVAVGIVVDRVWNWPLAGWLVVSVTAAAGAVLVRRHRLAMTAAVLSVWCGLGGAWHHLWWSTVSANDVAAWATEDGVVVRLQGTLMESAWMTKRPGPIWDRKQETIWTTATLRAESLHDGRDHYESVSGVCRLTIREALPDLQVGERLEILGILELPRPAANPGDFDYREFLRSQRVHAVVRAERVECVRRIEIDAGWDSAWGRWRQQARAYAAQVFNQESSPDTTAVAQALFLGVRRQIDDQTREDFIRSGLLHVLAISGVNVGLLALWFWLACRLLRLSLLWSSWIVLAGLLGYLFLTEADPPVWRATLVAVLAIGAGFAGRLAPPRQMIALAALIVLLMNPTDLFHAGAQLSFLSVVIVSEVLRWRAAWEVRQREQEGLDGPTWRRRCWRVVGDAYAVSTAAWLLTAPLVAYRFQLITPVGLVLNIVLGPLILIVMWLGYSTLLVGMVSPFVASWISPLLHAVLSAFLRCVRWGGRWDGGHQFVPGPDFGWLIVFYVAAGVLLWSSPGSSARRRALKVLAVLTVVGLAWGLRPQAAGELRMTVLSVGHGLSVVVSSPNGRTLVYDAGGMFLDRRVAETALRAVWRHGASSIDVLVLSHPDADHCNAVTHLLELAAVGGIGMHRTFVDERQEIVRDVLNSAADRSVPLLLLSAPQTIQLDPDMQDMQIEVIHPAPGFDSEKDNANSLVLAITYAGRTILLAGDLEADGLAALLRLPPRRVDVLLAPHHGSRPSNPLDLARWARPEIVIASSGDTGSLAVLEEVYGVDCLSTRQSGAITVRVSQAGAISVEPFKSPRPASR